MSAKPNHGAKPRKPTARPKNKKTANAEWELRLYVAGPTPRSIAAFNNLKQICEKYLAGRYNIGVIDLMKNPHLAHGDQIVAVPTLVRKLPAPIRRIIGNLSNLERVLAGLDLQPNGVAFPLKSFLKNV